MRKVYKKQSLWSKLVNFSLGFTSDKRNSSTEELAKKFIEKQSKQKRKKCFFIGFKKEFIGNTTIYTFNGSLAACKERVILYVHGGNFVQKANRFQISFAKRIAQLTNSTLIIPMYELLPTGNYRKMYKMLDELYSKIVDTNPRKIVFLGDSAGGGSILSYAMQIRTREIVQPANIILLSPWLDLSMSNPKLYDDAKKDKMNDVDGIRYEGGLWADGDNVYDPLISPMYGTFENLGEISLVFGGNGILSSECRRFDEILNKAQIDHNYILYEKEGHDFAAIPTREGRQAIKQIVDIISSC